MLFLRRSGEKKKVKFAARTKTSTTEEAYAVKSDIGGSIRQARVRPVTIDKKRARFTETLLPGTKKIDEDGFYDVESAMYSHYGGKLSGHGAKYDDPETVRFMSNTLMDFPEVHAAYMSGRVHNVPSVVPQGRGTRHPDILDYGGSLYGFSHSENGSLLVHNDEAVREFVIHH